MTKPESKNLASVLADLHVEARSPNARDRRPFATGLDPLDQALRGGFRADDLVLVGGKPGVGKTMGTLQWARNLALDGAHVVYACYEHTVRVLTGRLLLLGLGAIANASGFSDVEELRAQVADFATGSVSIDDLADGRGLFADALACVNAYADRLWLVPASAATTTVADLSRMVKQHGNGRTALFVDYLQKVPLGPEAKDEFEKVTCVASGLKELALSQDCLVVAIAASTSEGLTATRQRIHHLRGSSALAYEADVVIMMNEKVDAVSRVHLMYDPVKAETFRYLVVFSLEKNRSGPAGVDLEFQKDFGFARFVSPGHYVAERLVDSRVTVE